MGPEPMKLTKESDEVYYCRGPIVRIGAEEIAFLKAAAGKISRRRARICTHPDIENQIHEMLIIHAWDSYVPPHKHPGKSESFHIVEGLLTVILFDDAALNTTVRIGAYVFLNHVHPGHDQTAVRQHALNLAALTFILARHYDDFIITLDDRKSTRLNSSHVIISYAVFSL